MNVYSSADGEVMIECLCIACVHSLQWITDIASFVRMAVVSDLEEEARKKQPPMKLLPPIKPTPSKDEASWLHNMGLTWEEPKNGGVQ